MREVRDILNRIGNTAGRNDKEAILLTNKDNEKLIEVLKFMYDDLIVTGISKKKLEKNVELSSPHCVEIDNLMEYLKVNNTGSDAVIANVQDYISKQEEDMQEFYNAIATKNMKLGFTKNTLNSVYGKGFIVDFKVMLASKYQNHEDKVEDFMITCKLDGVRNVLIKENGKITMRTRQGKPMVGLVDIEEEAKNLPDNMVYDGELILKNINNLDSADLFRDTMKVVRKDGVKKGVEFHVFDMLPLDEFNNGKSKLSARDRKKILHKTISGFDWLKEVPVLYDGEDQEQIQYWLDRMEDEGHEGVMINLDVPYECKRTKGLLKVKSFLTADVYVVDVLEGTNTNEGKLGAIRVAFEHEGEMHQCNCGSGFTKEQREAYWDDTDLILGKIVEIGYFEISTNEKGGTGLRFPTFKQVRNEKTEISMH